MKKAPKRVRRELNSIELKLERTMTFDETLEKLQNLLRVLKSVSEKGFDLRVEFDSENADVKKIGKVKLGTCGAIGCAYGWSGIDPWFKRRGLVTYYSPIRGDHVEFTYKNTEVSAGDWFGLTREQEIVLFLDARNYRKNHAIAKTRWLIDHFSSMIHQLPNIRKKLRTASDVDRDRIEQRLHSASNATPTLRKYRKYDFLAGL